MTNTYKQLISNEANLKTRNEIFICFMGCLVSWFFCF